jgi:hypothetical protein
MTAYALGVVLLLMGVAALIYYGLIYGRPSDPTNRRLWQEWKDLLKRLDYHHDAYVAARARGQKATADFHLAQFEKINYEMDNLWDLLAGRGFMGHRWQEQARYRSAR